MNNSRHWYLTGKFVRESLTHIEQDELNQWIGASTSNKELFEFYCELWRSFSKNTSDLDFDSKTSWTELQGLVANTDKTVNIDTNRHVIWRSVAAAAAVALICVVTYFLVGAEPQQIILAATTEKQLFMLPDGTSIWLNKNSQLIYDSTYNHGSREVKLIGEAYFDVQHNPRNPFIIRCDDTYTKVLGTKFNVSGYPTDSVVVVSVIQGKVGFGNTHSENESLVLTRNYAGSYSKKSASLRRSGSESVNAIAWQTRELVFINSSLPYVISELEKFYSVQIDIQTPVIENCSFTGRFANQTLAEVMNILEFTLHINFLKHDLFRYSVSGQSCSI